MTKTALLCLAMELALAAVTLAHYGREAAGAAAAARATAWLSASIFAVALARRSYANGASLLLGFAAAHSVHLASVAYFASVEPAHFLRQFSSRSVIAVSFGVGLVMALFFSTGRTSRAMRRLNTVASGLGFIAFAIATATGAMQRHPVALLAAGLWLALGYHLYRMTGARRQAVSAAS